MFDLTIFSSCLPRGLFLAQKLSQEGQKVCYVDLGQESLMPLGAFFQNETSEEKYFLESLGLLSKQKGGFCLLSSKGVLSFQDLDWSNRKDSLLFDALRNKKFEDFKDHWLTAFSRNLAARFFEGNSQFFSEESLDFFSDYFLFEQSLKKQDQFQKEHPNITYIKTSLDQIKMHKKKSRAFFTNHKTTLESSRYLWLADGGALSKIAALKPVVTPDWEWRALFLEGDLGAYSEIIPTHFVFLKDLSLPWSHDNLLSVFYRNPYWEVWFRSAYNAKDKKVLDLILNHLQKTFSVPFQWRKQTPFPPAYIYGKKSLGSFKKLPENILCPQEIQGDLFHQIQYEKQWLKQGVFKNDR